MPVLIGTAGWNLPRAEQGRFAGTGSHLERYATRFPVVEINSSFRRSHRPGTWSRWRDSVPDGFRFSVKMPKEITHQRGLEDCSSLVGSFLEETALLGDRLGCLLVQLPPKLGLDAGVARSFFEDLRTRTPVPVVCEPRHHSWFAAEADGLLRDCEVARAAADPARVPAAASPGGWRGISYNRLHGYPKVYYSAYDVRFITSLADVVREDCAANRTVWVIFDNTTLGAATRNALDLARALNT